MRTVRYRGMHDDADAESGVEADFVIADHAELVGVVGVGVLSLVDKELFPDETVWSGFGSGYGYIPLVLPILGLLWLYRTRNTPA